MRESQTVLNWINEGRAAGRVEGRAEGRVEGEAEATLRTLRETLVVLLTEQFGSLSLDVSKQIAALTDTDRLRQLIRQVLKVKSLAELGL